MPTRRSPDAYRYDRAPAVGALRASRTWCEQFASGSQALRAQAPVGAGPLDDVAPRGFALELSVAWPPAQRPPERFLEPGTAERNGLLLHQFDAAILGTGLLSLVGGNRLRRAEIHGLQVAFVDPVVLPRSPARVRLELPSAESNGLFGSSADLWAPSASLRLLPRP